jgi:hypothetical protein
MMWCRRNENKIRWHNPRAPLISQQLGEYQRVSGTVTFSQERGLNLDSVHWLATCSLCRWFFAERGVGLTAC